MPNTVSEVIACLFLAFAASSWPNPPPDFRGEWLQVDIGAPTRVVGVVTQGRPPVRRTSDLYMTSYMIMYGNSTDSLQTILEKNNEHDLVRCMTVFVIRVPVKE